MKKLLRYLSLLTLALIASCTTIDEGMDKAEVLQVSTNKMEIEALSGKETFTITSYCDWLAGTTYLGNDSKWINLSSTIGHSGTKDVTITFDENKTADNRYAIITVSNARYGLSQSIEIRQKAGEPFIELDTESIKSIASGTTKNVTVKGNVSWEASCDADWVTITPTKGEKGTSTTVKVEVAESTKATTREAVIKVSNSKYKIEKQITVTQDLNENGNRMIAYTSSNNNIILPSGLGDDITVFGAEIVENKYINGVGVILFDGPITKIGESAFERCSSLTSITIPDSVTTIGYRAFYDCSSLTSVTIGDSVTTIGDFAFSYCSSLTSVYISDLSAWCKIDFGYYANPLQNGANLYLNNELVTELVIPSDITEIKPYAFYYCSSLTSVTIPDSVTTIGEDAFAFCCSLTSVTIPDSVTKIGDYAFYDCSSLTSVTIPDSVTTIGDFAFSFCESLTIVTIPDSVTTIGEWAFSYCESLTSITIPDSVTAIGWWAFGRCSSLKKFNGKYSSEDGRCLIIDGTLNSFAPAGLIGYIIPDSVTTIGDFAFESCWRLTSVTIPDSVTTIGVRAFYDCSSLISVYCKATTQPAGEYSMFSSNASGRKIYVPMESVEAYKSAKYWSDYANAIVGYDF